MNVINIQSKNRKKERIDIGNIDNLKNALIKEGYDVNYTSEKELKSIIKDRFNLSDLDVDNLFLYINETDVIYRVKDVNELIDYIDKMITFERVHKGLCEKINNIDTLIIDRVEYDREPRIQENVDDILKEIEKIANEISTTIDEKDIYRINIIEKEIEEEYVYRKDIELLKKMVTYKKDNVQESYNEDDKIKTLYINVPQKINYDHIKVKKGSVEYHEYLKTNIPRIKRLIKNVHKYINPYNNEESIFKINQSEALQDSINMAVAVFHGKEFKAISGSNEILDYCISPKEARFKSSKVNKLGKLGIGYNRVNDSEKKIFEEIHKQIELNNLNDEGDITLYSKWEPCPSCYHVINQFLKIHPNIKVKVRFIRKYGE